MADAKVLTIPPDSLIVLTDVDPGPVFDENGETLDPWEPILSSLREKIGHDRWVLLACDGPGNVEIISDPDQFPDWLADKLVDAAARRKNYLDQFVAGAVELPTVDIAPDVLSR